MRWGHVPSPYCIHRGLHKLLPGHFLVLPPVASRASRASGIRREVAADAQADRLQLGEKEALERLEALLGDAVGRRMIADVPLGAFLSGGIDSALIVALMQARPAGR